MDKGIYCLVLKNPACTVQVGALGPLSFKKGWHCYIGSALGSGGLKRLDRHFALFENKNKKPKWHIDYLLTEPRFSLEYAIFAATNERLECELARSLGGLGVDGFGCSDCSCPSHLLYRTHIPEKDITAAFSSLGLTSAKKTIISP